MFLIPNLILIAVSIYIIARGIQAYRAFREARLGLFAMGQILFAFSLFVEGLAGATAAPGVFRLLAPFFLMSYQIMGVGLLLIAISVTPSAAFAVFLAAPRGPGAAYRLNVLVAVDAALAAYIGAVLLYRYIERRGNLLVPIAYFLLAGSLIAIHMYWVAVSLRALAGLFLAAGVTYAEAEKK